MAAVNAITCNENKANKIMNLYTAHISNFPIWCLGYWVIQNVKIFYTYSESLNERTFDKTFC